MAERRRPTEKKEGPAGRGMRSDQERPEWQRRVKRDVEVEKSPLIPSEITPDDLDMGARVQLKTLTAENAEMVARHLAMVSLLIDQDPLLAHKHALAAARRAGRLAIVHETVGLTAYGIGDFALALRELLTHRRLSGSNEQLPIIVDSERGMGRPQRALEAVAGVDRSSLPVGVRINLAIALSGARLDLGQIKVALLELEIPELSPKSIYPQSPLLFRSYAEVLRELGKDAQPWEELANRAEHALANIDGEVVELLEELTIPTSEDFERKPKREFTGKRSAGERKPRRDFERSDSNGGRKSSEGGRGPASSERKPRSGSNDFQRKSSDARDGSGKKSFQKRDGASGSPGRSSARPMSSKPSDRKPPFRGGRGKAS